MPDNEFKNNIPPNIPVGLYQQTPQTVADGLFRPLQILQSGELVTTDLALQIARGDIPGMTSVLKFGRNEDIDTGTDPEDIWTHGGTWIAPTTNRIHDITSTSTNDDGTLLSSGTITGITGTTRIIDSGATFISDGVAVGDVFINDSAGEHGIIIAVGSETDITVERFMADCGPGLRGGLVGDSYRIATAASTGAAVVLLIGLNNIYDAQCEYIILNGTSNVPTIAQYQRIFRIRVVLGATIESFSVGEITATAQTDSTVTASIAPGDNQSQMAIYTIPRNKMGYMISYYINLVKPVSLMAVTVDLLIRSFGETWQVKHHKGLVNTGSTDLQHDYEVPLAIPPKADIKVRALTTANDADVSAGFDIILIDL